MGRRVAIVQSNYVPWKGYFDMIAMVDEFILLDDAQYTKRDWRNRNRIKTAAGPKWLTIPVEVSGRYHQRIDEVVIADPGWAELHWATLRHAYARADGYAWAVRLLSPLYERVDSERLSDVNRSFLSMLCEALEIDTVIRSSTDYSPQGSSTERLVDLCVKSGATEYLSGPAARAYLDEASFEARGITVRWMEYDGYREYPQIHPPFDHYVSIVDLLFNAGAEARGYLLAGGASS